MTEAELQANVESLIKSMSLLGYHTYDSRRSQPGFPDLVIVGRNGVLYRELKTATGKLSPLQRHWLDTLWEAGQDVHVWRPKDWPDRITRELRALGATRAKPAPTQADLRRKIASRGRK